MLPIRADTALELRQIHCRLAPVGMDEGCAAPAIVADLTSASENRVGCVLDALAEKSPPLRKSKRVPAPHRLSHSDNQHCFYTETTTTADRSRSPEDNQILFRGEVLICGFLFYGQKIQDHQASGRVMQGLVHGTIGFGS